MASDQKMCHAPTLKNLWEKGEASRRQQLLANVILQGGDKIRGERQRQGIGSHMYALSSVKPLLVLLAIMVCYAGAPLL